MAESETTNSGNATNKIDLQSYKCERCGYTYHKVFDYPPYLCYKCMRFVSKRTYTAVTQIVPNRPVIDAGADV